MLLFPSNGQLPSETRGRDRMTERSMSFVSEPRWEPHPLPPALPRTIHSRCRLSVQALDRVVLPLRTQCPSPREPVIWNMSPRGRSSVSRTVHSCFCLKYSPKHAFLLPYLLVSECALLGQFSPAFLCRLASITRISPLHMELETTSG